MSLSMESAVQYVTRPGTTKTRRSSAQCSGSGEIRGHCFILSHQHSTKRSNYPKHCLHVISTSLAPMINQTWNIKCFVLCTFIVRGGRLPIHKLRIFFGKKHAASLLCDVTQLWPDDNYHNSWLGYRKREIKSWLPTLFAGPRKPRLSTVVCLVPGLELCGSRAFLAQGVSGIY